MASHYDIIIIGTGAGGGTLAYALASTGKRILLLERGGYLPREQDNWSSKAVFQDAKYKAHEDWLDKDGKPLHPGSVVDLAPDVQRHRPRQQQRRHRSQPVPRRRSRHQYLRSDRHQRGGHPELGQF